MITLQVGRCRIPDLCKRNGITQAQLALRVGLPPQQITDYVSLRHLPNVQCAKRIANALHCCIDDLYEWESE
ncbi:helix-turn-helix domain-containing protein [Bacillus idriensis]|uniref:Helix-turn-helix domain-containing protein n=1 Tax=Metabacillus idriensis TaxID=324768 RepID=A0A6I2M8Z5_9BACI|nr:helix-turn-helix domain-containing protein [Metabacillus idriensis]